MKQLIRVALFGLVLMTGAVQAAPLDDARNAGHIVELATGYVEAKASAPAAVKALAEDVNKRRKAAYERIAKKNGITVEQVAAESYRQRVGSS